MRDVATHWRQKKWGIEVDGEILSNLRFADDLMLMASSKRHLKLMVGGLIEACAVVGLELHADKTKILHN
eukprot:11757234-Karenia_brevis.AAC.1